MSEPSNEPPFRHELECKMQDAAPQWYPIGDGAYERVCVCRKENSYPPRWVRPDPLDPKAQRHAPECKLLKIPDIDKKPEIYKLVVSLRVEDSATYATCQSCERVWASFDIPPQPAEATRS